MPKKLTNLFIRQIALVDAGANQEAHIALMKRAPEVTTNTTGTGAVVVDLTKQESKPMPEITPEEVVTITTDLDMARKSHERVEAELTKARDDLRAELDARQAELEASKAEVLKINKQRRRERFIKLAHELKSLPGTMGDDFGEELDKVEATLGKGFTKFYTRLTSWNVLMEKNNVLMSEIGRDSGGLAFLSGPEAQIEALTQEKMVAEKLNHAKAYAAVLREHPDLYKKYRADKGGK